MTAWVTFQWCCARELRASHCLEIYTPVLSSFAGYTKQCTPYIARRTVYHRNLYGVQSSYAVQCTVYIVPCRMYTVVVQVVRLRIITWLRLWLRNYYPQSSRDTRELSPRRPPATIISPLLYSPLLLLRVSSYLWGESVRERVIQSPYSRHLPLGHYLDRLPHFFSVVLCNLCNTSKLM